MGGLENIAEENAGSPESGLLKRIRFFGNDYAILFSVLIYSYFKSKFLQLSIAFPFLYFFRIQLIKVVTFLIL